MLKSTTVGVKVDGALRLRMRLAAQRMQRTPHWLMKRAICSFLERIEGHDVPADLLEEPGADHADADRPCKWHRSSVLDEEAHNVARRQDNVSVG